MINMSWTLIFYHDYTMIILELSEAYRELDILKNKQIEDIDG